MLEPANQLALENREKKQIATQSHKKPVVCTVEHPPLRNLTVSSPVAKVSGLAKYQNYTLTVAAITRAGPGVR